jgi:accessory gene regulator protein AgrB
MPSWIFSLLFFLGIAGFLVTKTVKILPYKQLVLYASIATIFLATYMTGAKSNNDAWLAKVAILEKQILELAPKSQQVNTDIDKDLVKQKQQSKDKTTSIIQYVDREVTKYDSTCIIPSSVLEAHNKAAK